MSPTRRSFIRSGLGIVATGAVMPSTLFGVSSGAAIVEEVTDPRVKLLPDAGEMTFSIFDIAKSGATLLSVPFYFAPGEVKELKSAVAQSRSGAKINLQVRVLSRHPSDHSVRTAMLRGIVHDAQIGEVYTIIPKSSSTAMPLLRVDKDTAEFDLGDRRVVIEHGVASVYLGPDLETAVAPLVPDFPENYGEATWQIVENGPYFAWLVGEFSSPQWKVKFEIKSDALGQIEFISRLLTYKGEHEFPHFGFNLRVAPFTTARINGAVSKETQIQLQSENRKVQSLQFAKDTSDVTFTFPDGAHVLQGRVDLDDTHVAMWRDPSLDKTKDKYLFREGQERSFLLAMPAPKSTFIAQARGEVSPQRRAASVMREKPTDWGDLQSLRREMAQQVLKLQSLNGDDWGDMTVSTSRNNPVYQPASLTRLDHAQDFLDDYFLGGERILADVSLRWARNYLELHLYRGADPNALYAERYALTAENSFPNFNQKGSFVLMHAYEETGDERYQQAAIGAADRDVELMNSREFFPSYYLHQGFGSGNNTRTAFIAVDLCRFYDFTGDKKYLRAARKIIENLEGMRARTGLEPELTTNYHTGQKTDALLSEGVGHPDALGDLALHSDGTGVGQSPGGFPKPFILDYHLRGAIALLQHEDNAAARSLLIHTANYLVENRNLMGTWNYPQVHSPHAILQVTASVGDDLLMAHLLTGDQKYFQVALEQAKLLTQLRDASRSANYDINLAEDKPYFYAEDFAVSDLHRSFISTDSISRDQSAHTFTFYNDYFALFPGQTQQLREPLQNPNARWVTGKMSISQRADRPPDAIAADYQSLQIVIPSQHFEEVLAPTKINHEIGNCYIYVLHNESPSDQGGTSTLRLFENGKELLPAHSLHADVRNKGMGRWSHWGTYGNRMILFSSSDNSDPSANGRRYVVEQDARGSLNKAIVAWQAFMQKYPDANGEYFRLAKLVAGTPQEVDILQKAVAANPQHPRSGGLRLRLFDLSKEIHWLKDTIHTLPNSIWARRAQTLLWMLGEGKRPEYVLADDGETATGFRNTTDLKAAAHPTEISVRRENDTLILRVVGHDWKRSGSSLQLYFDVSRDHEHWISFLIEAEGEARYFYDASWPGNIAAARKNEEDWSVSQKRHSDDLIFEISIPFAKLGVAPKDKEVLLLGLDVIRQENDETSFWCQSTKPDAVYPGDFGLLVLKGQT